MIGEPLLAAYRVSPPPWLLFNSDWRCTIASLTERVKKEMPTLQINNPYQVMVALNREMFFIGLAFIAYSI